MAKSTKSVDKRKSGLGDNISVAVSGSGNGKASSIFNNRVRNDYTRTNGRGKKAY